MIVYDGQPIPMYCGDQPVTLSYFKIFLEFHFELVNHKQNHSKGTKLEVLKVKTWIYFSRSYRAYTMNLMFSYCRVLAVSLMFTYCRVLAMNLMFTYCRVLAMSLMFTSCRVHAMNHLTKYISINQTRSCLSKPYHFKFLIGCLPQILLGLFLNTLTQL